MDYRQELENLVLAVQDIAEFSIRQQWPDQDCIIAVADKLDYLTKPLSKKLFKILHST